MTLRHMRIFVSVFRNKGITKAAHSLHLAQPSVSLSIRELEDYYGIHLFERIGRHIFPTEAGKELYGYALHIVSLFDEMEKKIRDWDNIGTLRVGTSVTIGTHILPTLIKKSQENFPDLTIEVLIHNSETIEKRILDNSIDIGLIETRPEHPDIIFEPFTEASLVAIAAPSSPLAAEETVPLSQLAQFPLLLREKGSAGREILDACFSLEQITIHPLWESASTQAIIRGVAEGLGVAVLPSLLVAKDIAEHSIIQVPLVHPLKHEFHIIYHKSKYLTSNMKAFFILCKKVGSE